MLSIKRNPIVKLLQFGPRLIIALLLSGLFPNAFAKANDKLTIFVDSSYPPYMYKLEGTLADGLYPRLLNEIIKQTEYQAEIKAYPWKRALIDSAAGKGAVGGAYKNDERVKAYDYSAPLYQEKLVIFVNKNNPFEFNTIEDLKGKVIGVNRGWSYGQEFDAARMRNLFAVNKRNDPNENFKMLALGRIDCLILGKQSGDSYIERMGIQDKVISLPNAFSMNNGYLIIPKILKMDQFLNDFNLVLQKMHKNGTYNKIIQDFIKEAIID